MEIVALHVEAFKSLYDVTCKFDHFSVVTGPNGSGKSNLVEALTFLGDVYNHGLEYAVSRAGGFENIAHRRTRRAKRPVRFRVDVTITEAEVTEYFRRYEPDANHDIPDDFLKDRSVAMTYRHEFAITTATQRVLDDFEIVYERVQLLDTDGVVFWEVLRDGSDVMTKIQETSGYSKEVIDLFIGPFGDTDFEDTIFGQQLNPTTLLVTAGYYVNLLWTINRQVGRIKVFQLSPHLSRSSGVATPNAALSPHGENLPGAADYLRRRDPKAWNLLASTMRSIIPNLTSINIVQTEDRRLALQFRERGVGKAWNSNEVSDGTIQTVALLVALFDKRNSIVIIEEPENAVHPWILRQYLDLCRSMDDRQILMTTHSSVVLNYVDVQSIRLMWMEQGRSHIERFIDVSPEVRELSMSGELNMFEIYDSGLVEQTVPRGFLDSTEVLELEFELGDDEDGDE